MLNGKITKPDDWHNALRAILDAPFTEHGVLLITSDMVSASVSVLGGRYVTGVQTSLGSTGDAALRHVLSVGDCLYRYVDANSIKDFDPLDDGLKLDINKLMETHAPTPYDYAAHELVMTSGSGRKRVNPFDILIYGAASTCMKLTALSVHQRQLDYEDDHELPLPEPDEEYQEYEEPVAKQNPRSSGVFDSVRVTAWKIASRLAHAAKERIKASEAVAVTSTPIPDPIIPSSTHEIPCRGGHEALRVPPAQELMNSEPTPVLIPEPTPVAVPEPTPVAVPEPTPVPIPEPTPVPVPEPTPVPIPEPTHVPIPEPPIPLPVQQTPIPTPDSAIPPPAQETAIRTPDSAIPPPAPETALRTPDSAIPPPAPDTAIPTPDSATPAPAPETAIRTPDSATPPPAPETAIPTPDSATPPPAPETAIPTPDSAIPPPAPETAIPTPDSAIPAPAPETAIRTPDSAIPPPAHEIPRRGGHEALRVPPAQEIGTFEPPPPATSDPILTATAPPNPNERLQENKRLRTVEVSTADFVDADRQRRHNNPWHDPATLAMGAIGVLGIAVVLGVGFNAYENGGGRPFLKEGKRLLAEGKNELAVGQFTMALSKNPNDADVLKLRAETYEKINDYEHASADYETLAQSRSSSADGSAIALKAAFYEFKTHKYAKAMQLCKAMPDDNAAKALMTMSLARAGDPAEAVAAAGKVQADSLPPHLVADYFASLGYAWAALGDDNKALNWYSLALADSPKNESILSERAASYMHSKQYKAAAADYASLTGMFPARAGGYADLANAQFLAGDYAGAAEHYQKAIEFSPRMEFYLRLADCHMALHKYGYVVSDCDALLTLQPDNVDAIKLRSAAMNKAKSEKAIVTANVDADPAEMERPQAGTQIQQDVDPVIMQGYNLLMAGNAEGAYNALRPVVKRMPNDNTARRYLASACSKLRRTPEAFEQYSAIAANNALLPSDELAYGRAAEACGHTERAMEIYVHALDRDPTFVQARVSLIRLCVLKGYADKAAHEAAEGMSLNPGEAESFQRALLAK
jgi:tetratricopeptide (TPR) repeat protein